ncbi:hypothetical protein MN116_005133 [Schistosoma mekongi]|uniref:Uncharacterized protein n=1 Tax=Schistosoma mekongi TaxID=38744 RepID=A0AAE1ZDH7_SCHME|nr:hypothetical protein MN116_005133 [Schistosoma mekongi]
MTTYFTCNNDIIYPNQDNSIIQKSNERNQSENMNSYQLSTNVQFTRQLSLQRSISNKSHNTIENVFDKICTEKTLDNSLTNLKSSDGCSSELQNIRLSCIPCPDIHPSDNVEKRLEDAQSLIQRHTEIVQHLEQLNKELLLLLHEEWSITGKVPPDYESLSLKLGICNKPVKNTSYPISHLLVHKASTVSMKQEYYEFLKNKKKYSTLATNLPTENVSIQSELTKIISESDNFSLPDNAIDKRYRNTARRLVEVFGRSVSTELLLPNRTLHNAADLTDDCSHSNSFSIHDYSTGNLTSDKNQFWKLVKTDSHLISEYYRLNHMTSISDYSSFLSGDYSPTTSLRSDFKPTKDSVNATTNLHEIISDFSSNLSSTIACCNQSNLNDRTEKPSNDLVMKSCVNEVISTNNEVNPVQLKLQQDNDDSVYDAEEEDFSRAAYEIELRRLEVDFAVISQLYAVHKQRAKETKFESYKIAYKSNSKKLKDITRQMNHIKTMLLSSQQVSNEQPAVLMDRRMAQKQLFKRRRTWNPLKLSTSNWTVGSGTSPRRSKVDRIKFQGLSSPVASNTAKNMVDICHESDQDSLTELPMSRFAGRRMQSTLPHHSKLCEEAFKCGTVVERCTVKKNVNEYFLADPLCTMNPTPIKKDVIIEHKPTLSNAVLQPEGPIDISTLNKKCHHLLDSPTNDPLAVVKTVTKDTLSSQDHYIVNKLNVRDRRRKYFKTSKRSHSLSSELFIVSVDDTYNLPHSLMNKIARVRSLPQFHNSMSCSSENMDNAKKNRVHESYSIDGKLKNLKRQPLSFTTQSSGIGLNNSSASVEYTDTLGASNLNCIKCIPKKTTSSNTSSSSWSTSGCSCLSSQTNHSFPYEDGVSKVNTDFIVEEKHENKPNLTFTDDYPHNSAVRYLEETTENKVILRHLDKRGRRVHGSVTENADGQPFGTSVSARCICSCLSERGHTLTTADSHICQRSHSVKLTYTNKPINKSDSTTAHEEINLMSSPSFCHVEETQSVNNFGDYRLHSLSPLNYQSSQTPKNDDGNQEKENISLQTPNNISTSHRNSKSGLKGRLSLKPFSLIRRAVSKVTTNSGRRSLNVNSPFTVHQKKRITSPTILPSLTTGRLKEMNSDSITNGNDDTLQTVKCSLSEIHVSLGLSVYPNNNIITNSNRNNNNVRRFTWAKKLRHSIHPAYVVPNKCTN